MCILQRHRSEYIRISIVSDAVDIRCKASDTYDRFSFPIADSQVLSTDRSAHTKAHDMIRTPFHHQSAISCSLQISDAVQRFDVRFDDIHRQMIYLKLHRIGIVGHIHGCLASHRCISNFQFDAGIASSAAKSKQRNGNAHILQAYRVSKLLICINKSSAVEQNVSQDNFSGKSIRIRRFIG